MWKGSKSKKVVLTSEGLNIQFVVYKRHDQVLITLKKFEKAALKAWQLGEGINHYDRQEIAGSCVEINIGALLVSR